MMEHGRRNTMSQSITIEKSWPISSHLDLMFDNNPNMYTFHECPSNIVRAT